MPYVIISTPSCADAFTNLQRGVRHMLTMIACGTRATLGGSHFSQALRQTQRIVGVAVTFFLFVGDISITIKEMVAVAFGFVEAYWG